MADSSTADYERSRRITEKCKDFLRDQTCAYLMDVEGDPSREFVIAMAEVAAELGFNVLGKEFVKTLFYELGGSVDELDDTQSLKNQLLASRLTVAVQRNGKN